MPSGIRRTNISFPKKPVDEATQKKLQKIKRLKILAKTAGAWKDSSHPDLKTIRDVCNWVNRLRRSDEKRLSELTKDDA